jgi:hypothetical protein
MQGRDEHVTYVEDRKTWRRMGLHRNTDRPHEWEPGSWRLTIVHDTPTRFRLDGIASRSGKVVSVELSQAEVASSAKVAMQVLLATRDTYPEDPNPSAWSELWRGSFYKDEHGVRRFAAGLQSKLFDAACHEYPQGDGDDADGATSKNAGGGFEGQSQRAGRRASHGWTGSA